MIKRTGNVVCVACLLKGVKHNDQEVKSCGLRQSINRQGRSGKFT